MPLTFNPAPGWPVPPAGWFPDQGWSPDPAWPPMPPGWRLVTLAGEAVSPTAYGVGGATAPVVKTERSTPKIDTRKRARDVVTSETVTYDRSLLPAGFSSRGLAPEDRAWWDDQFDDALADRDQARLQALVQGEVDRITGCVADLNARMAAMDRTSALRARSSMLREADAAKGLLDHVLARARAISR